MFDIIANIKNLPDLRELSLIKESNEEENSRLNAYRHKVRQRAILKVPGMTESLIHEAQITQHHSFNRYTLSNVIVQKVASLLGLRSPLARLQIQAPGYNTALHLDDLSKSYIQATTVEKSLNKILIRKEDRENFKKDPYTVGRFLIMMEDVKPGQGFWFDYESLTSWEKGDVIYHDWVNTAHATFNAGFWSRALIRMDGILSQKTKLLVQSKNIELNYKVSKEYDS